MTGKTGAERNKTKALAEHTELKLYLPRILPHLKPVQQAVLRMRLDQERSMEQIADALGCSNATAKSYWKKALERAMLHMNRIKGVSENE